MKDTSQKALRRGHNEGNIRQRTDGRWEVRLSAGIDYKTGIRFFSELLLTVVTSLYVSVTSSSSK